MLTERATTTARTLEPQGPSDESQCCAGTHRIQVEVLVLVPDCPGRRERRTPSPWVDGHLSEKALEGARPADVTKA